MQRVGKIEDVKKSHIKTREVLRHEQGNSVWASGREKEGTLLKAVSLSEFKQLASSTAMQSL